MKNSQRKSASLDLPEDRQQKNLLFDFYGALLTDHQQEIYLMRFVEDCSLAEIAAEKKVTPQAIVDILKRVTARLNTFEEKLGMIERHKKQSNLLTQMDKALDDLANPAFLEIKHALGTIRDITSKLKLL